LICKKKILIISSILSSHIFINAQDSVKTIVAKHGDGIINVLRSHGMNVTKYYERFLDLNKGNIRNGSELHLGRVYYMPDAPDSFERMGISVEIFNKKETAIFSDELYSIRKKDNSLENTVYFMVLDESKSKIISSGNSKNYTTVKKIAKELLTHGAKVYMLDNAIGKNSNLGDYTSIINQLYLKNNGKYQRLLVMNLNNSLQSNNAKITIAHHDKSKQGHKLASNIGEIFQEQNILEKSSKEYTEVFTDDINLYLAKNVLPVMTHINIESNAALVQNYQSEDGIKDNLSDLIIKGILQDYANLKFDDKD